MACVGSLNIGHVLLMLFYAIEGMNNYLDNRIDPTAIITNGD